MAEEPAGIKVDGVTRWLEEHVGLAAPLRFERIPGGHSNLTYTVVDAGGRKVVLRRPPMGNLLPTAHDMNREHTLISALHPTSVPVPPPLGFCEDPEVTGAHFYVMDFVEGDVYHSPDVMLRTLDGEGPRRCGEHVVDVLADLHDVDPDEVGLEGFARKEGYIARQLKRWYSQWEGSKTRELPLLDEVHDALAASIPEQGRARIVHGDYRLGNLMHAPDGRVVAVLDWEIATLGDPLADVGYLLMHWLQSVGRGEHEAGAPPSGFPTREEAVARYAQRSGRDLSLVGYYVAFSYWKQACIVEGVYARYLHGALDTSGVNLDGFKLSVERSVRQAASALELAT